MYWNYTILILCILLIFRFVQMKRSIRKGSYDYRYYEDGPYGKKKQKETFMDKVRNFFKG